MESLYEAAGRTYERARLNSRFEDTVYEILSGLVDNSKIELQKKLPGMRGVNNGHLVADFYVEDLRLMVEADGLQHRVAFWGKEDFETLQANDRLKDAYAGANGITLVRVKQTVDHRVIKAQLLRTIRRLRPRPRPLNPSDCLQIGGNGSAPNLPKGAQRRSIKRGETRDRPNAK
jgi:very-short-patch-repair endonuclease